MTPKGLMTAVGVFLFGSALTTLCFGTRICSDRTTGKHQTPCLNQKGCVWVRALNRELVCWSDPMSTDWPLHSGGKPLTLRRSADAPHSFLKQTPSNVEPEMSVVVVISLRRSSRQAQRRPYRVDTSLLSTLFGSTGLRALFFR